MDKQRKRNEKKADRMARKVEKKAIHEEGGDFVPNADPKADPHIDMFADPVNGPDVPEEPPPDKPVPPIPPVP